MHSTPLRRRFGASLLVSGGLVFAVAPAAAQPSCPYGLGPDGTCRTDPPDKLPAPRQRYTTTLRSDPSCEIFEKGNSLGVTPLKLDAKKLAPGRHVLEARMTGYAPLAFELDVKATEDTTRTITLSPLPALKLLVGKDGSAKNAIASVDGQQIGGLPIDRHFLSTPGKHTIRVEKPDFESWYIERDFNLGDVVPFTVELIRKMGHLSVGTSPGSLVDVSVYLDPDLGAEDPDKRLGTFIGKTPIDKLPVSIGIHSYVLSFGSQPRVKGLVYVPADDAAYVEAPVPRFDTRPSDAGSKDQTTLDQAIRECRLGGDSQLEACMEAGHLLMHMKKLAQPKEAEEMYARACRNDHPKACLALGWLMAKHGHEKEAEKHIENACRLGLDAACYHPYVPPDEFPDPTAEAGRFVGESTLRSAGFQLGGSVGFGPFQGYPISFELGVASWATLGASSIFGFGFGLHLVRLRLIHQWEETTGKESWGWQLGPGGEFFFLVGNPSASPVYARIGVRATAYWHDTSGTGGYVGIGRSFGKERNHVWELGAHLETMPLRTHRVAAFGGEAFAEDVVWRPMMVLRYAYGFLN